MTEFDDDEEKLASLLKNACGQVSPTQSFRESLLTRLMQEREGIFERKARQNWLKPLFLVPAGVLVLALIAFLIFINLPGKSSGNAANVFPSNTPASGLTISPAVSPFPVTPSPAVSPSQAVTPKGRLILLVKDAPSRQNVTEVNVLLREVRVNKSTGEGDAGWITVVDEGREFDLIQLRNTGMEGVLGEVQLDTGTYQQVRMVLKVLNVKIDGVETGVEFDLPGGILKLVSPFEIKEDRVTVVTIDFDVAESLVFTGGGKILFKPVVKLLVEHRDN